MKVIYEADDGTRFDDRWECEEYEWEQQHQAGIDKLEFYDVEGNSLDNKLSETTYQTVWTIVVPDKEALEAIKEICEHTGFFEYEKIIDVGRWKWQSDKDRFEKENQSFYSFVKEGAEKLVEENPEIVDAISRNDVLDALGHGTTYTSEDAQRIINNLPTV